MGHTPEQRTNCARGLCGAKKRNGEKCRAFAGQGTSHLGYGKCRFHGGNSPTHIQSAAIAEAKRKMVTMGGPVDLRPQEALLGLLRATAGHVAWLNSEVGALADISEPDARQVISIYGEERDRLARVSKACIDSGVSPEAVKMERETIAEITGAIERSIKSVSDLTAEQRKQFGQALRSELRKLQRNAEDESPQTVEGTGRAA